MKAKRFFSFSVREETTGSMDNISSSSCSWSPDKLDSPLQSLWLRTTLSESEKKMKAMMTLLEEGEVMSVETDDIRNRRKPELIKMLEDFNRSYRALAEQCDKLRSKSHHLLHSGSSSTSSSSRKMGHPSNNQKRTVGGFDDPKFEASDTQSESAVEVPDVECNSANSHFEYLNRLADELMSSGPGRKNTWHELKFQLTKLMEESLRQQAELLKRNDEKRKIIDKLRAHIECLRNQNRALQSDLRFSKVEVKSNQTSRLSGLSFNKFFKAGCS
ncbi:hypothetical protein CUMW_192960 [Citrus unshiu]|uniref:NAB domain-containing protein n=1 Tax=Citrus unshiu TaxID=55188 RepID=A0A2H5Q3S0_CITUN|nr:hypothetical protein CUMW_192960 [Citrus unshiu]